MILVTVMSELQSWDANHRNVYTFYAFGGAWVPTAVYPTPE